MTDDPNRGPEPVDPLDPVDPVGGTDLALVAVGVDHRSAPIALRERVALGEQECESLLLHLMARPSIAEAAVLSTCNRTEIYVVPNDPQAAFRATLDLGLGARAPEIEHQGRFFVFHGRDAARRLLSIAAGLESMVLGEPEILGQVREARRLAVHVGSAGPSLEPLLGAALEAGARARNETEIGTGAVSLGYAAVELASQIFAELEARTTLILGAGETARLVAGALAHRGAGRVLVANRDRDRAREVLDHFEDAEHVPFEDRRERLGAADIVVASTASDTRVLTAEDLRSVMCTRPSRPLLVVDLGVPRNVEPTGREVENVFLHDLDSLEQIVERNLDRRRREVPQVEQIVAEELARYDRRRTASDVEPLVAELQTRAERVRRAEIERVRERFPTELHEELDVLTRSLVRKILHHPSRRLREASRTSSSELEIVRELFQLGERDGE